MPTQYQHDVLIIGSGAAGLSLALHLAPHTRVALLSKSRIRSGSTLWAQGGIAAVMDEEHDSVESHVQDTMNAGAGLCHEDAVRFTAEQGKSAIERLIELGVPFSYEVDPQGQRHLHLTREGGHQHRRVIHATDATGKAVETTLEAHVRAHDNIELFESHMAIDLITANKMGRTDNRVLGAYVLNLENDKTEVFRSRFVVLATGGASKVYLYTTNPDLSTGDGIAMAWRAGCRVANMEFNQFHPTCLYHREARSFLISEAVRGEGGILRLPNGEAFMQRFDPQAELAPRDIVARAIDHEMKRLGIEHVYLDMTHKPESFIKEHFPTIYQRCLELGYNMAREPLPVVPAAHYTCGGVMTDLNAQTDLPGLFAVGECSFTGLHGANRMASNSLLECLVFAKSASEAIIRQLPVSEMPAPLPEWDESRVTTSDEEVVVSHNWEELRHFMWDYVGIVRTNKRLQRARSRVDLLSVEIEEYYSNFHIHSDLLELRNLVANASLIIDCALRRKESRGLHYTLDYPETDNSHPPQDTILQPDNFSAADSPLL